MNSIFSLPFYYHFTPLEWCHLCMRDGDYYAGGCCGNMNAIQDIVCGIFRFDSGNIRIKDLEKIAYGMSHHDEPTDGISFGDLPEGFESFAKDKLTKEAWENYTPWDKMACIWHIVKDYYSPQVPHRHGDHMSEVEKSVSVLSNCLESISYGGLFGNKQITSQVLANRAILLTKMLPELNRLNKHIDELDLGPVEGYALVDVDISSDSICSNGYGLCVYTSKEKMDETFKLWKQSEDEHKDEYQNKKNKSVIERIGFRAMRVSKEKGVEFLSDVKFYDK